MWQPLHPSPSLEMPHAGCAGEPHIADLDVVTVQRVAFPPAGISLRAEADAINYIAPESAVGAALQKNDLFARLDSFEAGVDAFAESVLVALGAGENRRERNTVEAG